MKRMRKDFEVAFYCACGEKMEYGFVTEASQEESERLWKKIHVKPGCESVSQSRFLEIKKKRHMQEVGK